MQIDTSHQSMVPAQSVACLRRLIRTRDTQLWGEVSGSNFAHEVGELVGLGEGSAPAPAVWLRCGLWEHKIIITEQYSIDRGYIDK